MCDMLNMYVRLMCFVWFAEYVCMSHMNICVICLVCMYVKYECTCDVRDVHSTRSQCPSSFCKTKNIMYIMSSIYMEYMVFVIYVVDACSFAGSVIFLWDKMWCISCCRSNMESMLYVIYVVDVIYFIYIHHAVNIICTVRGMQYMLGMWHMYHVTSTTI